MKETSIKLDEYGAEIKIDETGTTIIGKSINFVSTPKSKGSPITSDGQGNVHIYGVKELKYSDL
jgi:hypothetical protein